MGRWRSIHGEHTRHRVLSLAPSPKTGVSGHSTQFSTRASKTTREGACGPQELYTPAASAKLNFTDRELDAYRSPFHTGAMVPPGTNSAGKFVGLKSGRPVLTFLAHWTTRRMIGVECQLTCVTVGWQKEKEVS